MNKSKFYSLSFTWGLPMTIIGLAAMLILTAAGKRPERWGYCDGMMQTIFGHGGFPQEFMDGLREIGR